MFFSALDVDAGCAVFLQLAGGDLEADFESLLQAIARADEALWPHPSPIALQIVEADVPVPDARWRRRLAEATTTLQSVHGAYVLVTHSTAVRGAITAINWLRPPPCAYSIHASIAEAVGWAEARRGDRIPALLDLEARLRRASMRRSSFPPPSR
jgi:hypothetical protein